MERKVKILVDSASDMPKEIAEKYGIGYISMGVDYNNKIKMLELGDDRTAREVYKSLRDGNRVKTIPTGPEIYQPLFKSYLEKDYDIVYIACCAKQSPSINNAILVKRRLLTEYPEAHIYCIDSLNASLSCTLLAMKCAEMAEQGMTSKEIYKQVIEMLKSINEFALVDTLSYLARSNRIKASKATFGNIIGLRPIITADAEGNQAVFTKAFSRKGGMNKLINLLLKRVKNKDQTIYVCHADCSEDADELIRKIREKTNFKNIKKYLMAPVVGATTGPGTLAVFAFGEEMTFIG